MGGFGLLMTRKRQWMAVMRLLMLMRYWWWPRETSDCRRKLEIFRMLMLMRDCWWPRETIYTDCRRKLEISILLMLMRDCWWPRETSDCRRKLEIFRMLMLMRDCWWPVWYLLTTVTWGTADGHERLVMASTILVDDSDLRDCRRSWETADDYKPWRRILWDGGGGRECGMRPCVVQRWRCFQKHQGN